MRSSSPVLPLPVNSIVINGIPPRKATTTLLRPSSMKAQHHHVYNHWTLNERLRSKNEKLFQRQQSSCRLAFYSLWLFIIAGVMAILVYRFTDECPLPTIDRKYFILKCSRHVLFVTTLCFSFLACTGVVFGACRYFQSQPQPFLYTDERELRITPNYDVLATAKPSHTCCCQTSLTNGASFLPSTNHHDELSNVTVISSIQNLSPQRKVPPFTYDELPSTQLLYTAPLPPLPTLLRNDNANAKLSNPNHSKNVFFSPSTSASSSPQSIFSSTIMSNNPNVTNSNNSKRKSTLISEDASPSTPTSYTTCVCGTDVWERQQRPSIPMSPR